VERLGNHSCATRNHCYRGQARIPCTTALGLHAALLESRVRILRRPPRTPLGLGVILLLFRADRLVLYPARGLDLEHAVGSNPADRLLPCQVAPNSL
jgi:hypothetical protein